ncbi:efflux RND transporter permease subunit [Vulgatibacter incomptus]|uniref:RND efflux system, inner membrane transporter CmeB n=1 Tax=Vulgatibacter incomptus TaxID=1391653 RepID=A0A0K1PJB9_9BACT|nr:efflux RND transporter permease subunit [Vulgatibacter incomptus]AKU93194.1 RND efflux system, inner membrane transporter CmeB [Vulgatibacter incomptus]
MARFFIDRPIFAWVIAILIMLAGGLAILKLPVAQYPAIAPPEIGVRAVYPGADAQTLENTVTQVIEQKLNGIDGLRYFKSESLSSGMVNISVTFEPWVNPDIAQVQVQNKVSSAEPLLPEEVKRQGVTVFKTSRNFIQIFTFISEDGSLKRNDISDYVASNVVDQIARVPGVGETQLFGAPYAMKIWLDPDKLTAFGLTPDDVANAIRSQNTQISAGQLGGAPSLPGTSFNATITAQSRLTSPEEFRNILLRVNRDGAQVRVGDVARVELTGENADTDSYYNNMPAASLGVKLATGANALDTAKAVRAKVDELSAFFPPGMKTEISTDTTPFVRLSIESVVHTLFEAIILVFLVMFLFLQNFRATLIPTIAAPVVLLGVFGVLSAFGFTINTLTMFGMVLAIGLLVDDAIVVVENVERVMSEEGLSPKEATKRSMGQISSALLGVTTVLSAVFVPMAFFGGSVGAIYRQFSITIVSSMVLSLVVAMTFTPALCATMLKAGHHGGARKGFFGWFNRGYDRGQAAYDGTVGKLLGMRGRAMIAYVAIVVVMGVLLVRLPTSFLPDEDQGTLNAMVTLPPGSTMEQTKAVLDKVTNHFLENEKESVESVLAIVGFNYGGRGQNNGIAFVRLKDWSERKSPELRAQAVAQRAAIALSKYKEAMAFAFTPPAVSDLGTGTGFELQLLDRAGQGRQALIAARNQLVEAANANPAASRVRPSGQEDSTQYKIDIDREKAAALGLSLASVNQTLATAWGGAYVNDFIDRGRVKKVYMQADAPFRMQPGDLDRWYARNDQGQMVPFSSFASGRWTWGSPRLERFNGLPTVQIQGDTPQGRSSGESMAAMSELAAHLPQGYGIEWSGLSYEERLSGSQAPALYAISLLVIFLCLAALYESWTVPFSVMLVVPLGVIGALAAAFLFGMRNDVYFQVGLLTTIGLSAKNAILIVEFARELRAKGAGLVQATLEASRMRLRPILMTSLAFILGVTPLAISKSAGAGAQNAIGIGVIGGMVSGTVLAVLFVPVLFVVVVGFFEKKQPEATEAPALEERLHG